MRDLSLIQAAGLNTGINPSWTLQRTYADGETDLPPVGGRILRITFTTSPTSGDSIVQHSFLNNVHVELGRASAGVLHPLVRHATTA